MFCFNILYLDFSLNVILFIYIQKLIFIFFVNISFFGLAAALLTYHNFSRGTGLTLITFNISYWVKREGGEYSLHIYNQDLECLFCLSTVSLIYTILQQNYIDLGPIIQ